MGARRMWREYCGTGEEVGVQYFVASMRTFLSEHLYMQDAEVQVVLGPAQCSALTSALDVDGNGKVRDYALSLLKLAVGYRGERARKGCSQRRSFFQEQSNTTGRYPEC
jgi:hypothetical protein